ncbi:MAG: hypothetical protein Q8Q31_04410 [Nanoarchaeota archaeon]|nr:hypothetical protein [Nanoarchaeota archaeon]
MVDKKILEEVKYRKALGRTDILGIKRELFLQGYKPQEIDQAVSQVYAKELKNNKKNPSPPINPVPLANPYSKPQSNKNLNENSKIKISKKTVIIAIVAILLIIAIFLIIKSISNKPSDEPFEELEIEEENNVEISDLSLSVKEFTPEVSEGSELPFLVMVENKNYLDSVDLIVKIEIYDIKGKPYAELSKEEPITLTSDTSEVTYAESLDISSLKEGNYKMKITAVYKEEEMKAIRYFSVSKNRSLVITTLVQEQSCTLDSQCDDDNPCTQDICSSNRCTFIDILQCCGNFICEANENEGSCNADCRATNQNPESSDQNIIQQALSKTRANPSLASQLCGSIQELTNKDVCYSQIALNSSRSQFCSQISDQDTKDNCYLSLTTKINPVCDNILDPIKKETCLALLEN